MLLNPHVAASMRSTFCHLRRFLVDDDLASIHHVFHQHLDGYSNTLQNSEQRGVSCS